MSMIRKNPEKVDLPLSRTERMNLGKLRHTGPPTIHLSGSAMASRPLRDLPG